MKLYVVMVGDYDGDWILGIYPTRELAEAHQSTATDASIEEHELWTEAHVGGGGSLREKVFDLGPGLLDRRRHAGDWTITPEPAKAEE